MWVYVDMCVCVSAGAMETKDIGILCSWVIIYECHSNPLCLWLFIYVAAYLLLKM